MKTSTYFALLAEFNTAQIPLDAICEKYFGLSSTKAKRRRRIATMPLDFTRCIPKNAVLVLPADLSYAEVPF